MTKTRKHTFTITVTFDKACSASHALREVADTIHGEFYPTQIEDSDPGSYRCEQNRARQEVRLVSPPPSHSRESEK